MQLGLALNLVRLRNFLTALRVQFVPSGSTRLITSDGNVFLARE